jgi:hypothetical protein
MEYKQFIVTAFERQPGKWRSRVRRASGRALIATGRTKMEQFVTGSDAKTASEAMIMAMNAIDSGAFSRNTSRSTEKFWRRSD